jgi:microcystin-dependent protein
VTLTAAQSGLPGHNHGASSDQVQVQLSDGGHQHDELCEMPGSAGTCIVYGVGDGQDPVIGGMTGTSTANISAQTHDHVISVEPVQAAGAQDSHENMPPFLVAAFIIKT